MRVLCAPNSFKETLSAPAAAAALAEGLRRAGPGHEAVVCPVADGGEGTLEVLAGALGARIHRRTVTGPLGEPVEGRFALSSDGTGIVPLADASGLVLVPPESRDPRRTTTRGTGELIGAAVAAGTRQVIVCLGGSATVDGGCGIAQALGGRFFDSAGAPIEAPLSGGSLQRVARYEPPRDPLPEIVACCDVTNPLLGADGAAAVYAPQKGATPEQVEDLERALAHLAEVGGGDPGQPGAGSAGGAGWGLSALLGARLAPGSELVLDTSAFDERLRGCDLVLTGEGRLDAQTRWGKAPYVVARRAEARGIPTVAIVGSIGPGADDGSFARIVSLTQRYGEKRALADTAAALADAAQEIGA